MTQGSANNSPSALLYQYVDEVLNHRVLETVPLLFAKQYRDNDPLHIPGIIFPSSRTGNYGDLIATVKLLSAESVDLWFTLEDHFHGPNGQVAYRLFGEGSVKLTADSADKDAEDGGLRRVAVPRSRLMVEPSGFLQNGKVLNERLHITYRCTGIFACFEKFTQRWGPQLVY